MKRILLSIAFVLTANLLFAQKGSLTGILLDSANHKTTLNYATVSVFKGADTILSTYKLSDDKGVFKINNLEIGTKYRLVINAWMYNILRKEITITAAEPNLNLGNVLLSEKRNNLNEVVILSERPPVIVRKDTIEFNTESFKTLPTAVVEDLLKKLPGVTVGADGTIQVNGKPVSRILVDGKEFFGGDQQMATKNLPSNIIDKVSISNDAEATRRDPDLVAGNTPQVINLKLKKAIKQGAFGKLYAGLGLDKRFESGGIMNFFRDTTQVSVLGYGNNINKPGFSIGDVSRIGGFSRAGINQVNINGDSYSLNGIGFGGSATGIQKSAGSGANFNTLTKKGIKINGKYFFGYVDNLTEQFTSNDQNLGNDKLYTLANNDKRNRGTNHNFGAKLDWKIDSLTSFTFEPTVTLNLLKNLDYEVTDSKNGSNQLVNSSVNSSNFRSDNADYSLLLSLWKDGKKAGRTFNTSVSVTQKDNLSDNFNNSITNFFNPSSTNTLDQLRDNNIRNFGVFLTANYTEPISKKLSLRFILNGNYIDNENALYTFYKNPLNQIYDIAIPTLSQTVQQSGYKANGRINLRWKATKDLIIQPGIVLNTINLENSFSSFPSFKQNFQFIAGSLTINYKAYSFSYTPSFREPSVSYIQPVTNNTNPLLLQLGNSNLLPARSHQMNLNVYKYDTKRNMSYNINANGSLQNDGVIMERTIVNGVQTNRPINADGILQFHTNGSINKDFKTAKRQFTLGGGYYFNYNRNIVSVNGNSSFSHIYQGAPRINGRINLNDKLELGQSYSLGFNKSNYENSFFNDISFFTHNSETELIVRLPKKMVWETNFRYMYSTQEIGGVSNNQKLWNAGLTFLFMKNDRAQLKFTVNDILNQNFRRYIYITENAVRDFQTNNLGRHALVTLTYNIQNFGQKVGGKDTMFRF
ncbi:outer membrane beta-barrel protein [Pedobacter frigiditerrae]|uniref:outer membrane beta-barrel protein n=1 Tax=Pedobacter frigiditerrae TaxID=2530452 RepID=UPI0029319D84|nr:outer membrane beta-barrel protein [Pedobacter frigiditerrae]